MEVYGMEQEENSIFPNWRSYGKPSRIEVNPNYEEDERILAYRSNNRANVPVLKLSDYPEVVAEIESNCRMLRKCLIGVLEDTRFFSRDYLNAVLEKVWNIERGRFFVQGRCEGKFLITFEDREERDSVLERSPWNVDGGLLMLEPWKENVKFMSYTVQNSPVWVQIHGLTKDFQSAQMVAKLGMVAGQVRLIDWPENSPYMRVRTIINPSEPLVAGVYLMGQDGKQKHWVEFRYEGVCVLCHRCGVIGHVKKDCTISTADMNLRAQSKTKDIRAKLCQEFSAFRSLSLLVKFHGGCELHITETSQQARRHSQNPSGGRNSGSSQIHGKKQDNRASSSKPKMEWRPKRN